MGFLSGVDCMTVLESWRVLKAELMPERKRVEFWVGVGEGNVECYKLDIQFGDLDGVSGCGLLGGKLNALLLKVIFSFFMINHASVFLLISFC